MPQAEKPSPLVGEGGGEADERGKLEKKRKNRNTCEQNTTTILTCVRTPVSYTHLTLPTTPYV